MQTPFYRVPGHQFTAPAEIFFLSKAPHGLIYLNSYSINCNFLLFFSSMTQTETFLGLTTSFLEYEPIQEKHIFALFCNVWYLYYVLSNP